MALRNLVEGECGAANPLVQWSSHFAQEKSLLKVGLNHDRLSDITKHGRVTEEQLVDEFLGASQQHRPAVPQTYNMATLLEELQMTQQAPPTTRLHPNAHQDNVRVKEWVEEFAPPQTTPMPLPTASASEWAREFQQEHPPTTTESEWAKEFAPTPDEKWVEEFENQFTSRKKQLAAVAKEMTETVTDPEIQETEFMNFVQKLASGEAEFNDQQEVVVNGDNWEGEFLKKESSETANGGFWDRLDKEWEELASQEEPHPWLSEFEPGPGQYKFQENNPLMDVSQPLEEGLKRLGEGDLPSAVLLFEAEVQARPDSVQGWQLLGSTQADNEQDQAAISALHRCLELDAGNLAAHMSLGVCYTNESQQTKALDALRGWISHNPKYSSLVPSVAGAKTTPPYTPSFMTPEQHAEVKDLFLAAAQMSPESVDCDVQVGLGVLFNLSNEYDKAVDCFTAGLQVKPNDAMLWNKLGATLANSNRSEEAVAAYRKALELMPGFTRSRYNLGVSCINLGAYKEAVEHFLTALHLQQHAKGPTGGLPKLSQMSDGIWSTLRLALSLMRRAELQPLVHNRDLDTLMKEFGVD